MGRPEPDLFTALAQTMQIGALNKQEVTTFVPKKKNSAHTRPTLSIKPNFKIKNHNFCEVSLNMPNK